MAAPYDTYDYPSYWEGREYEHQSEIIALKEFLKKIPKIEKAIDIGSGYGRLTPFYAHRCKKIVLVDPSKKLLSKAKKDLGNKNIKYVQIKLENINKKFRKNSFDLVILVRVSHHIKDIEKAIKIFKKILKPGGHLIFEFPNKGHLKAIFLETLKGNITFSHDIFPKDLRCRKNVKKKTLPFFNYHPDQIEYILKSNNFKIIEKRSVSNIRSPFIKKHASLDVLVFLESLFQKVLSRFNFGPSVFILSRYRG